VVTLNNNITIKQGNIG